MKDKNKKTKTKNNYQTRYCECCDDITGQKQIPYDNDQPTLGFVWQCVRCFEILGFV